MYVLQTWEHEEDACRVFNKMAIKRQLRMRSKAKQSKPSRAPSLERTYKGGCPGPMTVPHLFLALPPRLPATFYCTQHRERVAELDSNSWFPKPQKPNRAWNAWAPSLKLTLKKRESCCFSRALCPLLSAKNEKPLLNPNPPAAFHTERERERDASLWCPDLEDKKTHDTLWLRHQRTPPFWSASRT
jgi:hypothetical protein